MSDLETQSYAGWFCSLMNSCITSFNKVLPFEEDEEDDAISTSSAFITDCYLAHDCELDELGRDTRARVCSVNAYLKARGLSTWFYEERVASNFHKIQHGVDNAGIALVFITNRYQTQVNGTDETDNLHYEFSYLMEKKGVKKIIPIIMEPSMCNSENWVGTLGSALKGKPSLDMVEEGLPRIHASREEKKKILVRFANKAEELVQMIQSTIEKECGKKIQLNQMSPNDAALVASAGFNTTVKLMHTREPSLTRKTEEEAHSAK